MITFRRLLMDRVLQRSMPLMRGKVLDIGGKKSGKRGGFRPPLDKVASWSYLNPDAATDPDFLGGCESIPVPDARFDTLLMTEVLEYVPDPSAAMTEAFRVLAPGGGFILTVPFLHPMHGDWEGDRMRFTEVRLRELALASGFRIEKLETMGSLGAVIYDLLFISLGYAGSRNATPWSRMLSRLLGLSRPAFHLLDEWTAAQGKYIHTGYFLELRKPQGALP